MKRKDFIKTSLLGSTGLLLSNQYMSDAIASKEWVKLCILHTNDVHSHVLPFAKNHPKYPNQGGIERRAALIQKIRSEEQYVLLFDAGDIFQGTPYFNFFKGELEIKAMNQMGYDAATIGNHDFDNGIGALSKHLDQADFKMLNANYILQDTPLHNKVKKHQIYEKQGVKIGVFGLGVQLEGLVLKELYKNVTYTDALACANKQANILKQELDCDVVICLSHLGYSYEHRKVSDLTIAKNSKNIDLIIGGHTHTFLNQPTRVKNLSKKTVLINQVGWAGVALGRIDVAIHKESNKNFSTKKINFFHKKNMLV